MSMARIAELESKIGNLENEAGDLSYRAGEIEDELVENRNRRHDIALEITELTNELNHEPFDEEV